MNEDKQNIGFEQIAPSVAGLVGQFGDALFTDFDQEFEPLGKGRVDVSQLAGQEFGKTSFGGDALTGVGTGVAAGSFAGPIGMAIGGALGLGSAVIKSVRQKAAERRFKEERKKLLNEGIQRNSALDFRDHVMNNFGNSRFNQYSGFYG